MPRQRIENLGQLGLNTDLPDTSLPPNAWTQLDNVITEDGAIRSANGERKLFDLTIRPAYHTAFIGPTGIQYFIVSNGIKTIAHNVQGIAFDLTPTTAWSGGPVTFTNLNGILVVNSQTGGPFYWSGVTTDLLKPLPGWDTNWRCAAMVAFRYYLVALGMIETGEEYPHKVRWSNSAAEGQLPTLWVAAASNDAGADLIGETPGKIVGGDLVRDGLWIVKEDAVYEMRWIGGEYVMQLSRLAGGIGTRIMRGFTSLRSGMAIFTTSDLVLFDGTQNVSLVDQRVRRGIFSAISEEYWELSQLFYHAPTSQLVVSGVSGGYTQLSKALVLNLEENTWSSRNLHFSYGFDAALVTDSGDSPSWDELGAVSPLVPQPMFLPGAPWDAQTDGSWNKGVYQPSVPDIVVYESNPEDTAWWISVIGPTDSNHDGEPIACRAERLGIPIEGADGMAMITDIWPELSGNIPVEITVGGQTAKDAAPVWDAPIVVTPGVTNVITPRITGRFMCLRVDSNAVGSWRMGALTLNWQMAGER